MEEECLPESGIANYAKEKTIDAAAGRSQGNDGKDAQDGRQEGWLPLDDNDNNNRNFTSSSLSSSLILFSGPLVRQISSAEHRLPPTYVGVRRVRPSTHAVQLAMKLSKSKTAAAAAAATTLAQGIETAREGEASAEASAAPNTSNSSTTTIAFKIVDPATGQERRMTSREKKQVKNELKLQKALEKKRIREEREALQPPQPTKKNKNRNNRNRNFQNKNKSPVESSAAAATEETAETTPIPTQQGKSGKEISGDGRSIADSSIEQQHQQPEQHSSSTNISNDNTSATSVATATTTTNRTAETPLHHKYFQLEVDAAALETELADLRGERNGVPPVVISPPFARQAFLHPQSVSLFAAGPQGARQSAYVLPTLAAAVDDNTTTIQNKNPLLQNVVLDDNLSAQWAQVLTESMIPAVRVRQGEDLRPMVYDIRPQVWSRLRPVELGGSVPSVASTTTTTATTTTTTSAIPANEDDGMEIQNEDSSNRSSNPEKAGIAWAWCQIRPPCHNNDNDKNELTFDTAAAAVIHVLHVGTGLHGSCGAKFGCDFLIYDGPRHERHAFAGLRVVMNQSSSSTSSSTSSEQHKEFPLPRAYDLAGYVRCLNTAGKLALLATVQRDGDLYRVAIIDLALEQTEYALANANSNSHYNNRKRRKTLEERYQNLSKATTTTNK